MWGSLIALPLKRGEKKPQTNIKMIRTKKRKYHQNLGPRAFEKATFIELLDVFAVISLKQTTELSTYIIFCSCNYILILATELSTHVILRFFITYAGTVDNSTCHIAGYTYSK